MSKDKKLYGSRLKHRTEFKGDGVFFLEKAKILFFTD